MIKVRFEYKKDTNCSLFQNVFVALLHGTVDALEIRVNDEESVQVEGEAENGDENRTHQRADHERKVVLVRINTQKAVYLFC